jgi:hypothetical protein
MKTKAIAISNQSTNAMVVDQILQSTEILKECVYHWISKFQSRLAELTRRKERSVEVTDEPFDFLASYRDTHLSVSAVNRINSQTKNPVIAESVPYTGGDTASLNAHIEEVVQWFREYGREGLLTTKQVTEEPLRLSDAA